MSAATMLEVGAFSRAFLSFACQTEVNGLESFLQILESRKDPSKRTRGLLTGELRAFFFFFFFFFFFTC